MSSTDELFASLGGSLMKDLWADLQVDVDDDDGIGFSLEQLERELAHLDDSDYTAGASPAAYIAPDAGAFAPLGGMTMSAASLIVSHHAEIPATPAAAPLNDAWQQSLEAFTAMSLEKDFLAADSARKSKPSTPSSAPPGFLADAEDYNITESIAAAPPGLGRPPPGILPIITSKSKVTSASKGILTESPIPARMAPTPHNSISAFSDEDLLPEPLSFLPQPAIKEEINVVDSPQQIPVSAPLHGPPQGTQPLAWEGPPPGMPSQGVPSQGVPSQAIPRGMLPPPQAVTAQGMMSPQSIMSPQGMPVSLAVGIPVPQLMKPGTPWQSPPPLPPQPQQHLYWHTHPAAPPIPAVSIESSTMKSRDLAFVLHSMLKPVLLAGSAPTDYDVQLMQRRNGENAKTPLKKPQPQKMTKEMDSRSKKTMEWMKDQKTLGAVTKTDVTRPRALLAVSSSIKKVEEDESQKDRAALWKARLYIDQGQGAATALLNIWQSATPGTIPPQVHAHLKKLFKVLGVVVKDDVYSIDESKDSLQVILKLSKGKTFVARLFEHALLPPKAAQAVMPAALKFALAGNVHDIQSDGRLFASFTRILTMLPQWNPEALLGCLASATMKEALISQPRMECLHALLRRGNSISEPEDMVAKWKAGEADLMNLIS